MNLDLYGDPEPDRQLDYRDRRREERGLGYFKAYRAPRGTVTQPPPASGRVCGCLSAEEHVSGGCAR